jgi:hypothetical protein
MRIGIGFCRIVAMERDHGQAGFSYFRAANGMAGQNQIHHPFDSIESGYPKTGHPINGQRIFLGYDEFPCVCPFNWKIGKTRVLFLELSFGSLPGFSGGEIPGTPWK